MSALLLADHAVLLVEREKQLHEPVSGFNNVHKRRKWTASKVNNKAIVSERNSGTHYRISKSVHELERDEGFRYLRSKLSRDSRL